MRCMGKKKCVCGSLLSLLSLFSPIIIRPRNQPLSSVVLSRKIATTPLKMEQQQWDHTLTINNINPCIKTMEYAVRGPLVIRATEIEKEIEQVRAFTLKCQFSKFSQHRAHHVTDHKFCQSARLSSLTSEFKKISKEVEQARFSKPWLSVSFTIVIPHLSSVC